MTESLGENILRGVGVSDGLAMASIRITESIRCEPDTGTGHDAAQEQSRFEVASEEVRAEIELIKAAANGRHDEWTAEIFESHLFFLEDPEFAAGITRLLDAGHGAEFAVNQVRDDLASMLENSGSELMSERAADVRDICDRLIRSLQGEKAKDPRAFDQPIIWVAEDLLPLDALSMDPQYVKAVVTEKGGPNGHGAIVARSLGIPAVVAVPGLLFAVKEGVTAVVDGGAGLIELNPLESRREEVHRLIAENEARRKRLGRFRDEAGRSRDGRSLALYAHADPGGNAASARENGAEGIGLFRTEFLYMSSASPPNEDAQYDVYRSVLSEMDGRPVIFRTLDAGGDKGIPYLEFPEETNPFLGLRGIRYTLSRPDLFIIQLRALLRAGYEHELRIMFPMVAVLEEVKKAREFVEKAMAELRTEGLEHNANPLLGMMVEVPSVALNAASFANHVDFFSIGTNDLIQYTMAADRMSPHVASLYRPADPAVLMLIDRTVRAAHEGEISVSLCGEMGSNPDFLPLLLGLELDAVSINGPLIPAAKESLSRLDFKACRSLAKQCMECGSSDEAEKLLGNFKRSLQ